MRGAHWILGVMAAAVAVTMTWSGVMAAEVPAVVDEPQEIINPQGHAVPSKGALIAELTEDLDPKIKGPETVVRLYQDVNGTKIREYAINGLVFQVEVIPYYGIPYVLIDQDGNGLFESRYDGPQGRFILPQWVLFRF
ncbi:MAG: DUF2782 domain-containing protein [Magnetococcales bacterium]|nr:DUF2782 domain-containing protein [Magnetococcales bacterium]